MPEGLLLDGEQPAKTIAATAILVLTFIAIPDRPPFDVQVPLMSLPALLHTTLATIPADVPPELIARWRSRLDAVDDFKIGIAWQGNPHHRWDRWRLAGNLH
jgi:hypothetical protein